MQPGYHTQLKLTVDWADLDLFGHVNNVAFFRYVQSARVSYCESIGLTSLNAASKLSFMVASTQCAFKQPLHFPGTVTVFTKVNRINNTSVQLQYRIVNGAGELVAEAVDVLVVYDHFKKQKVGVPEEMRRTIREI